MGWRGTRGPDLRRLCSHHCCATRAANRETPGVSCIEAFFDRLVSLCSAGVLRLHFDRNSGIGGSERFAIEPVLMEHALHRLTCGIDCHRNHRPLTSVPPCAGASFGRALRSPLRILVSCAVRRAAGYVTRNDWSAFASDRFSSVRFYVVTRSQALQRPR